MESQAMIDYYAAAGMNDSRMVLTGSMSDDALVVGLKSMQSIRERLCAEFGFDPSRPLVLSALPPDFFYVNGGRPQCDFKTYDDVVAFWIESLAELKDCNCVVALHPSVDARAMRHVERDNVRIGAWRTAEMVPACDIYVASITRHSWANPCSIADRCRTFIYRLAAGIFLEWPSDAGDVDVRRRHHLGRFPRTDRTLSRSTWRIARASTEGCSATTQLQSFSSASDSIQKATTSS